MSQKTIKPSGGLGNDTQTAYMLLVKIIDSSVKITIPPPLGESGHMSQKAFEPEGRVG